MMNRTTGDTAFVGTRVRRKANIAGISSSVECVELVFQEVTSFSHKMVAAAKGCLKARQ